MKKITNTVFSFAVVASMVACGGAEKKEEKNTEEKKDEKVEKIEEVELKVLPSESTVNWSGTVLGVYTHSGTVEITDGVLSLKGDQVTGGNFTANLKTMRATDDNYNPEEGKTKDKLIEHLSSPDFFMVDSFPTATFEIISHDVTNNTITGNLTIRGNTNEEVVNDVMINLDEKMATGKITFNRNEYDVAFSHPAEDVVISDDVELEVNLKM